MVKGSSISDSTRRPVATRLPALHLPTRIESNVCALELRRPWGVNWCSKPGLTQVMVLRWRDRRRRLSGERIREWAYASMSAKTAACIAAVSHFFGTSIRLSSHGSLAQCSRRLTRLPISSSSIAGFVRLALCPCSERCQGSTYSVRYTLRPTSIGSKRITPPEPLAMRPRPRSDSPDCFRSRDVTGLALHLYREMIPSWSIKSNLGRERLDWIPRWWPSGGVL